MSSKISTLTFSDTISLSAREELFNKFQNYNAPIDEIERSMALFLRGSQLARILAIQEIYLQIVDIPGSIFDIGTWRGSTAVLCENLRAIYEPLNFQRHIYAFDTFEGYNGFQKNENKIANINNGKYKVENDYDEFLANLLALHEKNNAMGHITGKHSVIKGDVLQTIPKVLHENGGLSISLALFDLNCYQPTLETLKEIETRLLKGGIIAFWQFGRKEIQAEAKVFYELLHKNIDYSIHKCKSYPSLVYIKKV